MNDPNVALWCGDSLDLLRRMPSKSVDLVLGSPPYDDCRTYDIGFKLTGGAYVEWAFVRYMECLRVSRGLVAWVIQGKTKNYRWSATPALLMARLHQAGVHLRLPPLYKRYGSFGSGGPDWLRNDYEFVICATERGGRLPWSNNVACGQKPKCPPGGRPSRRGRDGKRVQGKPYKPPELANPGNVLDCGAVGGGNIGDEIAHENEAPFPERIPEFYVPSFCPPNGIVLDPFMGSGTTVVVARRLGRRAIGMDIRESQLDICRRRLAAGTLGHERNPRNQT